MCTLEQLVTSSCRYVGFISIQIRDDVPILLALTFVIAPLPNAIFAHCGSDEYGEGSGPIDLGRFITSIIVLSGFALPIILAHSEVIVPQACVLSIVGGGYVHCLQNDGLLTRHV